MHVLLPYRHYELVLTSYKLREVFTKMSLPAPFRAGHGQREYTTSFPFTDAVAVIGSGEPAAPHMCTCSIRAECRATDQAAL